jgi:hypothetical protein
MNHNLIIMPLLLWCDVEQNYVTFEELRPAVLKACAGLQCNKIF